MVCCPAPGFPEAVVPPGPRQVGKTTLAHEVAASVDFIYLDLESAAGRAKLSEPEGSVRLVKNRRQLAHDRDSWLPRIRIPA